jgi:hypothetical protein
MSAFRHRPPLKRHGRGVWHHQARGLRALPAQPKLRRPLVDGIPHKTRQTGVCPRRVPQSQVQDSPQTASLVCHTCQPNIAFVRVAWPPRAVAYGISSPTVREQTTSDWREGGVLMSAIHGVYGGPPGSCATYGPWPLRVYTPTPDGYEHFLRESVGLPVDRPGPRWWRAAGGGAEYPNIGVV